ncbi:hypothetical protein GCM10017744_038670 [Streptomyces antimycoticus]|uniref:Uncharacterized protein n=1 Tax=Streptomyces antimycoticus TaxID=68175 RepID=A0A4D4KHA8_9ACTN|nr:hypothetical protein SANT12839_063910 [Streptomyces antimycoticus]
MGWRGDLKPAEASVCLGDELRLAGEHAEPQLLLRLIRESSPSGNGRACGLTDYAPCKTAKKGVISLGWGVGRHRRTAMRKHRHGEAPDLRDVGPKPMGTSGVSLA